MEDDEELTLVPVYRFEWSGDQESRTTGDIEGDTEKYPGGVEHLAELGRADPDCTVNLESLAN